MFDIYYKKNDNKQLFKCLEKREELGLSELQNYIPIYNKFFKTNESNFNKFNLNQKYHIKEINEQIKGDHEHSNNDITKKKYNCHVREYSKEGNEKNILKREVFLKCCPLMDPLKYMIGKYDISSGFYLPTFNSTNVHKKILRENNASYVDGFFTYLTSQLKNSHNFIHGLDFYGSFLGIQKSFRFDVIDDLEYLYESRFFKKNNGTLFTIDEHPYIDEMNKNETRNYKEKIKIHGFTNDEPSILGDPENTIITLDDIKDIMTLDELFEQTNIEQHAQNVQNVQNAKETDNFSIENKLIFSMAHDVIKEHEHDISKNNYEDSKGSQHGSDNSEDTESTDSSSFSSRTSNTSKSDVSISNIVVNDMSNTVIVNENDSSSSSETSSSESLSDDLTSDVLLATINKFPVEVICLECCDNTFDSLFTDGEISSEELLSALFQIIVMLATYQKVFSLTHNDLHTNNIMFVQTDIEYIYYVFNNKHYRVPTYGRIYKIIDYGRSIYKYNGTLLCSDSFHPDGDAATQYNFGTYYNEKKKKVEPNHSFDLCRLSCSLIDYFVDDISEIDDICKNDPIIAMILGWCYDDKGRNILYKKNGEERYKEFKLYKMISRTVHKHIPSKNIENAIFSDYIIDKKHVKKIQKSDKKNKKKYHMMNIDTIPVYS